MRFDFEYMGLNIQASCEFDVRVDGDYCGDISFVVINQVGKDVTYDIAPSVSLDIHQEIRRRAFEERKLDEAIGV